MDDAVLMHRLHFGFTITYHYLFPQVTMGLALLIVVLKSLALARNDARYDQAARFWAKIFAVNFVFGVMYHASCAQTAFVSVLPSPSDAIVVTSPPRQFGADFLYTKSFKQNLKLARDMRYVMHGNRVRHPQPNH